jgi:acetolactate synthase-1/2/3 large subunit
MIVVGSRLRGNETRNNKMQLPRPLIQIDADASQGGRNYPIDVFAHGDAADALRRLLERLPAKLDTDPNLVSDIARAKAQSAERIRETLGPYQTIADVLSDVVLAGKHPWVRDVTISNSTFGNRYVRIADPRLGVHALGGGIGQGVSMGIGAALGSPGAKAITLLGDGGTMLGLAEMITAVEERAPLVFVLMNDKAYGVIQNIQDAQYGSRRHYSALATPDFEAFCGSIGLRHRRVADVGHFRAALEEAIAVDGPCLIEIDMCSVGPFSEAFAGPPAGAAGKPA